MGWFLVGVGLYVMIICVGDLLSTKEHILTVPMVAVIAIMIFRGGIHLLKVAVAARLASQLPVEPPKPVKQRAEPARKPAATPWDW